jgi:hypothetical protein
MEPGSERVARIRDTLHPGEMYVSEAVRRELAERADVQVGTDVHEMFDERGALREF